MSPGQEHLIFYYQVGFALTQWTHVEQTMRGILQLCVAESEKRRIGIAFHSTDTFRGKLKLCTNLLHDAFKESPHLEQWKTIRIQLEKASQKRNRLAHEGVVVYLAGEPGERFALTPSLLSDPVLRKEIDGKPPPAVLHAADIANIRQEFFVATLALMNFRSLLDNGDEPFPPSNPVPNTTQSILAEWATLTAPYTGD